MPDDVLSKEQRVLRVMRKVLASIIKDTTPQSGMVHVLSDRTIEDIRDCFGLISVRERELAEGSGLSLNEKPYYVDEKPKAHVVPMPKTGLRKNSGKANKEE